MFIYIQCLILLCVLCTVVGVTIYAQKTARAISKQEFLKESLSGYSCTINFTGCSLLCCNLKDIAQLEQLLSTEYDRYEVVIVIDTRTNEELLLNIVQRFKMIRVNTPDTTEIPNVTIRQLFRSRQRCFRRLILIDKDHTTLYDDLNAATIVASYDYLIPIHKQTQLRPYAIESIIADISSRQHGAVNMLQSAIEECFVFRREAIIEARGFGPTITRHIPRKTKITTFTPIFQQSPHSEYRYTLHGVAILGTLILISLLFIESIFGITILVAALAITAAARHASHQILEKTSFRGILYNIGRSIARFYPTKFFV